MGSDGTLWMAIVLCLLGAAVTAAPAVAEIDGSVYLAAGETDSDGTTADVLDQRYNLTFRQQLTDYLSMRLGYRRFDFSSETAATAFERQTDEPRLELIYSRRKLFGSLTVLDRATSGAAFSEEFDTRSILGNLSWKATDRLDVNLRFRDESNTADVAVFGRNTDTLYAQVDASYRRRHWGAAYSVQRYEVENRRSGLETVQDRYEARLDGSRRLFDDRLTLTFAGQVTEVDRSQNVPAAAEVAQPVPARQGLVAVDPSPEVGPLDPAPALIDGDLENPVEPEIEIGAAFTFRNLGVDLGVTQPVTLVEVVVDAPSDPGLVWEVWHSADNLLWERVDGVQRVWDGALLRYVLRIPETTDRFFKAVNVSANAANDVAVTEVRALRDVAESGFRHVGSSTLVRADAGARFTPNERVTASVSGGISQDEGVAAGALLRDYEDVHYGGNLAVELPGHLRALASYRYVDFENRIDPVVVRKEATTDAGLRWHPLETFDVGVSYRLRDEEDETSPVRSTETRRIHARAELLPELELRSSVEWTDLEDELGGFDRTVFAWHQRLTASPRLAWTVTGGVSSYTYEREDGEPLLDRTDFDLRISWRATAYLSLTGDWTYSEDTVSGAGETQNTLRQSYNVSYTPGTKLSLSGTYQEYDDDRFRETIASTAAVNYRLNPRFRLFGNLTRSETTLEGGGATDISTFRTGLAIFF